MLYTKTSDWGMFDNNRYVAVTAVLKQGINSIKLVKEADDQNFAEIDRIEIRKVTDQNNAQLIVEVIRPNPINVAKGTTASALPLPQTVKARLEDGSLVDQKIQWDTSCYHADFIAAQTIRGTIVTDDTVQNGYALTAALQVFSTTLAEELEISQEEPADSETSSDINTESGDSSEVSKTNPSTGSTGPQVYWAILLSGMLATGGCFIKRKRTQG